MSKFSNVVSAKSHLLRDNDSADIPCNYCKKYSIDALKFTCMEEQCNNYSICAICYGDDKHDVDHRFKRYLDQYTECIHLPPRRISKKEPFSEIFAGAIVERSENWKYDDEDGGVGNKGYVVAIIQPEDSSDLEARVNWGNGSALGATYNYPFESIKSTYEKFHYYIDHMPISRRYLFLDNVQINDYNWMSLDHYQRCPYITFRDGSLFGNLIIFNQDAPQDQQSDRDKDEERLFSTFEKFYFKIEVKRRLSHPEYEDTIRDLSKRDFRNSTCFIAVIMSYREPLANSWSPPGENQFNIDEDFIQKIIENKTLHRKPKIIIFVGIKSKVEQDVVFTNENVDSKSKIVDETVAQSVRDVLKCFSFSEEFTSLQDETNGTPYIQTFCDILEEKGVLLSIQDIVLEVTNRLVDTSGCQQVPITQSSMICHFCLGDMLRYNMFNFGNNNEMKCVK